jgi:crotonobetainyl-CoA:carnitine CoA-transferase CaiB-like acyl-CoA transferase
MYPWGMYECQDGLIFLVCAEEDQWERLVELMGHPEWTTWDIFSGPRNRMKNQDALKVYVEEWTRQWKVEDLFHAGQARLCFAIDDGGYSATERSAQNVFIDVTLRVQEPSRILRCAVSVADPGRDTSTAPLLETPEEC